MVANIRCAEIAADQLAAFTNDVVWQGLQAEALSRRGVIRGLNTRVSSLLDSCIRG
jgi:hypothetical protein